MANADTCLHYSHSSTAADFPAERSTTVSAAAGCGSYAVDLAFCAFPAYTGDEATEPCRDSPTRFSAYNQVDLNRARAVQLLGLNSLEQRNNSIGALRLYMMVVKYRKWSS